MHPDGEPLMQDFLASKGTIWLGLGLTTGSVSWLNLANQYVDLAAGICAVGASIAAILWYVKKLRTNKDK